MSTVNAGIVTAYGAAVRGGYTGTYDQFCAQQAQIVSAVTHVDNIQTDVTEKATSAALSATSAATSAAQAAASAALIEPEKVLGDFASYQTTTTASKAYKVGEYLTYNGYLYRVTTAIASGGTITPGTNCVQTSVGDEVANACLRFDSVAVSATTGDIATITDGRITADHVVAECTWGDPSAITSDVTVTTTAGSAVLNGTCTTATTVTLTLVKKQN